MLRRTLIHPDAPANYRSNFIHFYFDIGWYGILSGSAVNFLGVYLTRIGASTTQIGLLSAVGAVVAILLAIPAGRWLEHRPVDKAVFWTAIGQRIFYLLWIPLPWLLAPQGQIWAMIGFALLMAIPATALGVGFNTLFAAGIPPDWRAQVSGNRNIVHSMTFMLSSLLSGYILDHVAMPAGYQIVFAIGVVGAVMSTIHLYFIRPLPAAGTLLPAGLPQVSARPRSWHSALRLDVWKTAFGPILVVMLFFTLAQYLALPLFPIFNVRILELTDTQIGIGTAIFYLTVLIGSTQLARLSRRFGHHKLTALGSMALCIYPIILSFIQNAWIYFPLQVIGGLVWAMVGGAQANYLLENIPGNDRPAYLAWFSLVVNVSVLVASLAGPLLSNWLGLSLAMFIFGVLRLLGGFAILRWGRGRPLETG